MASPVGKLGGTPLVPPTPIAHGGAFALYRDPAGNIIEIRTSAERTESAAARRARHHGRSI